MSIRRIDHKLVITTRCDLLIRFGALCLLIVIFICHHLYFNFPSEALFFYALFLLVIGVIIFEQMGNQYMFSKERIVIMRLFRIVRDIKMSEVIVCRVWTPAWRVPRRMKSTTLELILSDGTCISMSKISRQSHLVLKFLSDHGVLLEKVQSSFKPK